MLVKWLSFDQLLSPLTIKEERYSAPRSLVTLIVIFETFFCSDFLLLSLSDFTTNEK